jgi:hypothetical protein
MTKKTMQTIKDGFITWAWVCKFIPFSRQVEVFLKTEADPGIRACIV